MHGVDVKDIAAGKYHLAANPGGCQAMGLGQQQDELAAEIMNLGCADKNVAIRQFGLDLAGGPVLLEQRPTDKNQDIISRVATRGDDPPQLV